MRKVGLILAVLICLPFALMAQSVTVHSDGVTGDYATISAALAAVQGNTVDSQRSLGQRNSNFEGCRGFLAELSDTKALEETTVLSKCFHGLSERVGSPSRP